MGGDGLFEYAIHRLSGQIAMTRMPRYGRALTYPEVRHVHFAYLVS